MDRQTLNALKFSVIRWVRQLTWPWMIVAGLLVFGGGVFLSVITPAQRELHGLHQQLAALQQQVRNTEKNATELDRTSPLNQLAAFYDELPVESSLPDWLGKIVDAARNNDLQLKEADYRVVPDKRGKLLRYQITLPLNGSYLNIRKFLTAVLVEIPTASLDNVKFERQKIGDGTIEAIIDLTLYFGPAS